MPDDKEVDEAPDAELDEAAMGCAEFLEGVPPSQIKEVADLFVISRQAGYVDRVSINTPDLQLHCSSESCNGPRFFRYESGDRLLAKPPALMRTFLTYVCSNCKKNRKIYSLHVVQKQAGDQTGTAYKFGEYPIYGPPTPTRLLRLFGNDRETFLKGRRCENQGLGIGAFVYYRRVVENHKNQILDEIIRVAQKVGAPPEMLDLLEAAKVEIQFSKALASVKDAMPQALLINGHNPLTLLHSALSVGVHDLTDEKCLELAQDIRIVMSELAERLGQALKDEAELNQALSRLMKAKS